MDRRPGQLLVAFEQLFACIVSDLIRPEVVIQR